MPTGPTIILALKVLVSAVTVLLLAAIWAIATGRRRLHGRLNLAFLVLTLATVGVFEGLLRAGVAVGADFTPQARQALRVHLYFAVPSAALVPVMYWSGLSGRRRLHLPLTVVFSVLWAGTVVTGLFFLPHD